MRMSKERDHIERIRKDKFWLDEYGLLREKNPLTDDLKNSIEHLSKDLYSKDTHFIFELIQNAEDNTYIVSEPTIFFELSEKDPTNTKNSKGALIIQNNEIGFNYDDVKSICSIGKSTKTNLKNQGYIGEKGIGFKSVFKISTTPYIFSNGYQFCFHETDSNSGLGYIVPFWIYNVPVEIDAKQTTIVLPLDKCGFDYAKIKEMLLDIEPETTLFLSKLKEIRVKIDDDNDLTILKDDRKKHEIELLIEGKKYKKSYSNVKSFLTFTKTFIRPNNITNEKRKDIIERDVSIAFNFSKEYNLAGKIFAYLPIRSGIEFPFIINSDFILSTSREDIQDIPWNRWLIQCVANLLENNFHDLKEKELLTIKFLEALTKQINKLDTNSIFHPIAVKIQNILTHQEVIPADDDTFISAENAILASADWLRKLLRQDQLHQLYHKKLKWVHGDITEKRHSGLWKYLREKLHIEVLTPRELVQRIDFAFLDNQNDQWMINFYTQLSTQKALWSFLKRQPFIRLQDGSHVTPFDDYNKPNAYLSTKPIIDPCSPIVKAEIASNNEARRFLLTDLKIPEFDIAAEVTEHVIPKYMRSTQPQKDEHFQDIKKIVEAFQTDSHEKHKRLKNALKNTPFVLSRTLVSSEETYRKPNTLYFLNDSLKIYFSENSQVGFVSSIYNNSTLKIFATLGVSSEIRVQCKSKRDSHDYIALEYNSGYRRGQRGFDPDIHIEELTHALIKPSIEKSLIIWNTLCVPYRRCIKGKILRSSRQDFSPNASTYIEEEMTSENFGRLLMDSAWLPSDSNKFKRPAEICLDELPREFERNEKLSILLGMKKDVIAKLAEEAGISSKILDYATKNPKKIERLIAKEASRKAPPTFPGSPVRNPERRKQRIGEQLSNAPNKEYEKRERNVRITNSDIDPRTWLRNQYTNEDDQMVCQICKEEMPFRKRDGTHYFEKKEVFSRDYLPKEYESQYLALCPLCAAKYDEFIKTDKNCMKELRDAIFRSEDSVIPIILGNEKTTIRFTETHYHDLKTIVEGVKWSLTPKN